MKPLDLHYYVKCQTIAKGSEICVNIYRCCNSLSDYKSDKDVYHSVFTRSDPYLGAENVLQVTAHILCSYLPNSIVET